MILDDSQDNTNKQQTRQVDYISPIKYTHSGNISKTIVYKQEWKQLLRKSLINRREENKVLYIQ